MDSDARSLQKAAYRKGLEASLRDFAESSNEQILKYPQYVGPITERWLSLEESAKQVVSLLEQGWVTKEYAAVYLKGFNEIQEIYRSQLEPLPYDYEVEAEALCRHPAAESIRDIAKRVLESLIRC
ncbi:MAG: hypothetical protein HS116_23725 [Planctomycetes bacterium]|nr:hypothetical protein [Planctomycetota bacterium]